MSPERMVWCDGRENRWKTIYSRNWVHIFRECLTTGLGQDYWWIYLTRVRLRIQKCHRNVISSLHSHDRQAGCRRKTRMQSSASLQPSPWFFESVSWLIHSRRHKKRGVKTSLVWFNSVMKFFLERSLHFLLLYCFVWCFFNFIRQVGKVLGSCFAIDGKDLTFVEI